jgi:hypothetical protein
VIDPVQDLIQRAMQAVPRFPPNSRYQPVPVAVLIADDGRPVAYLRRRFVPPPESLTLLQQHVVVQGDRLDLMSAKYVGDPELYWQICDANGALRPEELTEIVGRRLRITLPKGVV